MLCITCMSYTQYSSVGIVCLIFSNIFTISSHNDNKKKSKVSINMINDSTVYQTFTILLIFIIVVRSSRFAS